MQTTEISFRSGVTKLVGTLTEPTPRGRGPIALLISGSGKIDRDSNMKRMPIDVMGQVAAHLEGAGVSSFRYDKRGVGASEGDFSTTGFHDNVTDAKAAIASLRDRLQVQERPMFVVGHSEGALIAAELVAADSTLAGAVLLAGTATSGEDVLRWQAEGLAKTLPKPVKLIMGLLRQDLAKTQSKRLAQIKASTDDVIRMQFVKVNAKWMREFMAHDPQETLLRIDLPLLAITGSKDVQVNPADVERIVELAGEDSSGHVLEDVTHLLRSDDGPATVRTYKKQIKRPVDVRVLNMISTWITDVAAEVAVESAS
ncbi:MAG: alpha/beta fold hydrolase [Acidimicrobiia bacterium]|nr:alpha/beta fold hydrolase [Acidimicrobiia bacterium]